jgi:hypothetical protein
MDIERPAGAHKALETPDPVPLHEPEQHVVVK